MWLCDTHHHECGGEQHPADEPVVADPVPDHLLDAAVQPPRPEHPADGDGLEEDAPQQRHAAGRVEVHQLEDVDAVPGDHGQPQQEHEHRHAQGELLPVRLQGLGPVVHQPGHEALHAAELGVDAEGEQHDEEEEGPERGGRHGEHHLGVHQEGEPGPGLDHVPHLHPLGVRHVAQDGEDHHGGEEGGEGVDAADEDRVLVTVVVELVVAAQRQQSADTNSVGKEDLGASIYEQIQYSTYSVYSTTRLTYPDLALGEPVPVRGEEVLDAVQRALEREGLDAEDAQNHVREDGGEPEHLHTRRGSGGQTEGWWYAA